MPGRESQKDLVSLLSGHATVRRPSAIVAYAEVTVPTEPDELLPKTVWLLIVLPPPRFPATAADDAFEHEEVGGSRADVAVHAFAALEEWGYKPIGRYEDTDNHTETLAYSSESATVWVVFFMGALAVLITPQAERDPSRLNHHLAPSDARKRVAVWGTFPLGSQHVPAAARRFLEIADGLLRGSAVDFGVLLDALERSAARFGKDVSKRASWKAAQELAKRGRHRAAVRALASLEQDLLPEEALFLENQRRAATLEPPQIERAGRSDRDWFLAQSDHINSVDHMLKNAFDERVSSEDARVAWSDAASELHDALDLLYDDLENAITKSKLGDPDATEYLVVFLEADPWCFRSGYMKGRVYESLRRAHLDHSLQERLRPVLLNAVDAGYRREFRSSCRLARQLADPLLTGELRRRLAASPDPHVRRRALWMLAYLPEGLEGQEGAVLHMLIQTADDENWLRVSDWVRKLCRRFTTDEFAQQVRGMSLSADEATARRGLRLLPSAIRQPLDAGERLALEARIIDAAYGRGPGVHIIESLAAIADTGRLRRRLADLATNAESPVKRYARWGLNAAMRANGKDPPDL